MKFAKFRAPFLSREQIEASAEAVRSKYPVVRALPVRVLEFAEFDLELDFEFAPIEQIRTLPCYL